MDVVVASKIRLRVKIQSKEAVRALSKQRYGFFALWLQRLRFALSFMASTPAV